MSFLKTDEGKLNIKPILIVGGILLSLGILIGVPKYRAYKEEKEHEQMMAEEQASMSTNETDAVTQTSASDDNEYGDWFTDRQKELWDEYGTPPDGFKWSTSGNLIPLGTAGMSAQDVMAEFMRGLSMSSLDVAQKYSVNSTVISKLQSYRSNTMDYFASRFIMAVKNMAVVSVDNETLYYSSEGVETEDLDITIFTLDFSDRTYWEKDRDTLFAELLQKKVHDDYSNTKIRDCIYDYLLELYDSGDYPVSTYKVQLTLAMGDEGYLVTNDESLYSVLIEEDMDDELAGYILNDFNEYYEDYLEDLEESREEANR